MVLSFQIKHGCTLRRLWPSIISPTMPRYVTPYHPSFCLEVEWKGNEEWFTRGKKAENMWYTNQVLDATLFWDFGRPSLLIILLWWKPKGPDPKQQQQPCWAEASLGSTKSLWSHFPVRVCQTCHSTFSSSQTGRAVPVNFLKGFVVQPAWRNKGCDSSLKWKSGVGSHWWVGCLSEFVQIWEH